MKIKNGIHFLLLSLIIVSPSFTSADTNWTLSGTNIYNTNVGNIGIGTTTPEAKLDIFEPNTGVSININRGNGTSGNGLISFKTLGVYDWLLGERNTSDSDFHLYGYGTGSDVLTFLRSNGNMGIGTSNPSGDLSLSKSGTGQTAFQIQNTATGGRDYLLLSTNNGNAVAGGGKFTIFDSTAGAYRATIDSSGNVGIGTTSPTEKLSVSGNIKLTGNITSDGDICIGYCQ